MAVAAMAGVVAPPETGAALSGQSLAAISRAPADLALPISSAPPPPGATSPNASQLPSVSQQEEWATTTGACVPYRGGDSADRRRPRAREWFAKGVAATPGAGNQHHH
jgi:protein SMG6